MRKALLLALLLAGCGGSSSETQPPLEPDPSSYRYTGPRIPREGDEELMPSAPALDEDDLLPPPKSSARSTWGSGNPAPAPPPAILQAAPSAAPAAPSAAPAAPSAAPAPSTR